MSRLASRHADDARRSNEKAGRKAADIAERLAACAGDDVYGTELCNGKDGEPGVLEIVASIAEALRMNAKSFGAVRDTLAGGAGGTEAGEQASANRFA
ncbi:hypothetical protein OG563_07265 [Nocardia vinacea]|uniref:ESX-1 secretion-associated protein n=1 Tax=Nocardia vinacea TaxID=96468 RepID=A0ABZ1YY95_9NOCA|nr:hypothetical protein [Nocardia vinacea]